jgi:hypothetical protein
MMNAADHPMPSPEEIQHKLAEFMKREFGDRVQLAGTPQTESAETGAAPDEKRPRHRAFDFDFKPKDIKAHLDRFIIQQDDAKKVLSIAGLLEELHRLRTELAYWRPLLAGSTFSCPVPAKRVQNLSENLPRLSP